MNVAQLPANMQNKIVYELCPKPELPGFCWAWTGAFTSRRYGSVSHEGTVWSTHKLAYVLLVGPVPDGLQIDHVCTNKRCCNPAHLEAVTGKVNCGRTEAATKLRCKSGHPLAGPNLRLKLKGKAGTQRQCVVCEMDTRTRQIAREATGQRKPSKSVAARREAKRQYLLAAGEEALAAENAQVAS